MGSDYEQSDECKAKRISIHAPRVGSDDERASIFALFVQFQSTLPVWGATASRQRIFGGVRFQSTLPVWGATAEELDKEGL